MTYRHQIPACGWKAVLKNEDGSYSTIPLVCFEILCADEEDEEDYSFYKPECENVDAKPKKGSALEAVGLAFFETHPQPKPTLALSEVHTFGGFMGYLPAGESLEEWLDYREFKNNNQSPNAGASAMKYTELDLEHKRAMALNFQIAMFAFAALESVTGVAKEVWITRILEDAEQIVDSLNDAQVEQIIQSVELQQSHKVTDPWVTTITKVSE